MEALRMVKHYILMSSDYVGGTRIALDITSKERLQSSAIKNVLREIRAECGQDVSLSTHILSTYSADWESVRKYDSFFEGVVCADSVETFSIRVKRSRILSGLNVANYILSKVRCTYLSLAELVYFAYADYLCKSSKRLFEDCICAFPYGITAKSVHERYRKDLLLNPNIEEAPAKSRILFAYNGIEKLTFINRTIDRYGDCTARELVDLTHRIGSPWSLANSFTPYQIISDDVIQEKHYMECLP